MIPIPFVIFHLKAKIERKTEINIKNNRDIEHPTPDELTLTGFPLCTIAYTNHGTGNLEKSRYIIFLKIVFDL